MTTEPTTIKADINAGPIALALAAIAFAISNPVTSCNHGDRCARWIDGATSVQDRVDRTAQCRAEAEADE